MHRCIRFQLILVCLSTLWLANLSRDVGEATGPQTVLFASTPTAPTRSPTPSKASGSPSAQPKSAPTRALERSSTSSQAIRLATSTTGSSQTLYTQNFDVCSMPCPGWTIQDLSSAGYQWKDASYRAHSGTWAAWPARGGTIGRDPSSNNQYADNMDTRMIYGPFDLSDAVDAKVEFWLWYEIEKDYDYLLLEASTDGSTFQPLRSWTSSTDPAQPRDWAQETVSLSDYAGYSKGTGDPQVWVAWRFKTDGSETYQGPWVDDVAISKILPGEVLVQGTASFFNRDNGSVPTRYATVHLYDHNTSQPDYLLDSTGTDQNGSFRFSPTRNWEYWSDDTGRLLDLYIVVEASYFDSAISSHRVVDTNFNTYRWGAFGTPASNGAWNVADGTVQMNYLMGLGEPNQRALWFLGDLRRAWKYVYDQTGGTDAGSARIVWAPLVNSLYDINNSYFWAIGDPFIFIQDGVAVSSDAVVHETGHNYMTTAAAWWHNSPTCWQHDIFATKEPSCGWSEGWADYFPLVVNAAPGIYDACYDKGRGPCTGTKDRDYFDLEAHNRGDNPVQFAWGASVEGRVAGVLYDLHDGTNEGYDVETRGFPPIWSILRNRNPVEVSFSDFGSSWAAAGNDWSKFMLVSYWNTIDYGLRFQHLPLIMK
jgi:hypothetical protein